MNFHEYLKTSRNRNNLSQEKAAELMGVSTTSIQKWEKDTLPDKEQWAIIIDTYKLDKNDFAVKYANTQIPNKKENDEIEIKDFPYFLFSDGEMEKIKELVFTKEEQELLGFKIIYEVNDRMTSGNDIFHITTNNSLNKLPYEYVNKMNPFYLVNLNEKLEEKLGNDNKRKAIINYLKQNPQKIFNIYKLTPLEYWEFCKDLNYDLEYIIKNIKEVLALPKTNIKEMRIGEIYHLYNGVMKSYVCIERKESEDEDYLKAKEQYQRDLSFYRDHKNMLLRAPKEPETIMEENIVVTEKGKVLLEWYEKHIEEK